jgi:tetrahydromethanopterin S-methyltransferase subunit B
MKDLDAELARIEGLEIEEQISALSALVEELENSLK